MKYKRIILPLSIASILLLTGCSPSLTKPDITNIEDTAEVLVYREFSLNKLGATVYFGEDKKKYFKLSNNDYGVIKMSSGFHKINIGTPNNPYKLSVNLEKGQRACFQAKPKFSLIGGVIGFMSSLFTLEKVDCPSEKFLKKLEKIN